jgi:branched-chain amino acid transport system substrate-binding protein
LGSTFEAPQGQVTLDPTCSHASLWSRIGLARRDGQFEVVRESASAVPADPFLQCAVAAIR